MNCSVNPRAGPKNVHIHNFLIMNLAFQLPKNFERTKELSHILEDFQQVVRLEGVFLSAAQLEGNDSYHILTFIVPPAHDPLPQEIYPLVTRLGKEHPYFKIKAYTESQVEMALARGSLYFIEHCCLGKVLFAAGDSDNKLEFKSMALESLLERAVGTKKAEMRKIEIFATTAKDLIRTGDLAMATYNMHQAFELSFRFIQKMGTGHTKVTHSLITHINYTKHYFPTLVPFAEKPNAETNELLMLLEHSYSGARYGDDFDITQEQVQKIHQGLELFLGEIESVFTRHLLTCRERARQQELAPIENLSAAEDVTKGDNEEVWRGHETDGEMDHGPVFETLKRLKSKHFKTFKPHRYLKNAQSISVKMGGYVENSIMITHILKVCMLALDSANKDYIVGPYGDDSIREVLGLVLEMIPFNEMEFLDEINGWVPGPNTDL